MPSLPIPLISSLILTFMLLRLIFRDRRVGPLTILLFVCAIQGVIISAHHHYGVSALRMVQPVTATLLPPTAWVALRISSVRAFRAGDLAHFVWPIVAAALLTTQPDFVDALIPLVFVGYGGAILWAVHQGGDALPRLPLGAGDRPAMIWGVIGASLVGSALTDVSIVGAQLAGLGGAKMWIISLYSSVMLLVIGGLILSNDLTPPDPAEEPEPKPSELDEQIFARFEQVVRDQRLYLNSDLTLVQVACKLGVPVKTLSAAINKTSGENVSRYINRARIDAAKQALRDGQSITNAMLNAGFNTKSNFNREFLRVEGINPTDWLAKSSDALS